MGKSVIYVVATCTLLLWSNCHIGDFVICGIVLMFHIFWHALCVRVCMCVYVCVCVECVCVCVCVRTRMRACTNSV